MCVGMCASVRDELTSNYLDVSIYVQSFMCCGTHGVEKE